MSIQDYEDFLREWHWYAVDQAGCIAHFANGGLRRLPRSIRRDSEIVEEVDRYFSEEAPAISDWLIRPGAENDAAWVDAKQRDHHLKHVAVTAVKGVFSYDTDARSESAKYYLIALPNLRLTIDQLPESIRRAVMRTRAPFRFDATPYIAGAVTVDW